MKQSSKNIIKFHGLRIDRALHNYLYFTQYHRYVPLFITLGKLVVKLLGNLKLSAAMYKGVFDRYHSKVMTLEDATKILSLNQPIDLGPDHTKRIIPYPYANNIVFNEPDYIAVMDCPCRLRQENPCQPITVCMAIGKHFADLWLEHCDKYNVRKISQEEALDLIKKLHEDGKVTTAWLKVGTGGITGVLCHCCSCCCGGMQGRLIARQLKYGKELSNIAPSGYSVEIDEEKCISCGECSDICSFNAIQKVDGKFVMSIEECMGCGICVENCKQKARTLVRDTAKGDPLDIDFVKKALG